jgi:hypothetical protein
MYLTYYVHLVGTKRRNLYLYNVQQFQLHNVHYVYIILGITGLKNLSKMNVTKTIFLHSATGKGENRDCGMKMGGITK